MTNGFRMTIGADRSEIARVSVAFAKFADRHALPAPVRRSAQVALDELLANAIDRGGAGQASIEIQAADNRVTITLADDGRPFDPFAVPAPDTSLPLGERPSGGLGIHLVRGLMDEVSYERRGDRNVVVLIKLF